MTNCAQLLVVPLVSLATLSCGLAEQGSSASSSSEAPVRAVGGGSTASIEEVLAEAVSSQMVGSAVGLVARDGHILFLGAAGEAGPGVPIGIGAIVRLASSAKAITAAAALILVEGGTLSLDDPVSLYIPEFEKTTLVGGELPARPIAVRDLMTHTAGLDVRSEAFEMLWEEAMAPDAITTFAFSSRLARFPLQAHPGEVFDYGYYGSSYEVLAAVIEAAGGKSLDELIAERIFEPLGMDRSYFTVPETRRQKLAARYYYDSEATLAIHEPSGLESPPSNFVSGGGQVRTTIGDFYRFASCLLNEGELDGVRILRAESVRLMLSAQASPELYGHSSGDFGWGFGGRVRTRASEGSPGAVGTYSWEGGTGTSYWIDPENRMIGILFTPFRPPAPWEVHTRFETVAYEAIGGAVADRQVGR